ncbi:unnamed protein product, partial [Polarella glacialis]
MGSPSYASQHIPFLPTFAPPSRRFPGIPEQSIARWRSCETLPDRGSPTSSARTPLSPTRALGTQVLKRVSSDTLRQAGPESAVPVLPPLDPSSAAGRRATAVDLWQQSRKPALLKENEGKLPFLALPQAHKVLGAGTSRPGKKSSAPPPTSVDRRPHFRDEENFGRQASGSSKASGGGCTASVDQPKRQRRQSFLK